MTALFGESTGIDLASINWIAVELFGLGLYLIGQLKLSLIQVMLTKGLISVVIVVYND
ncbi:hypothetical protein [Marinilactibacillus psychrotolerans]|uniref:hypothetical protein n=1 Tax=Marinilactibacillus psychrotolerans TaxID=191770 RepID=UPI0039B0FB0B